MTGYDDCVGKVVQYMGGKLSERQVKDIVNTLERRAMARRKSGAADPLPAMIEQEAQELAELTLKQASLEKRAALKNMQARQARRARIEKKVKELGRADLAVTSELVGINKNILSGRLSTAAKQNALAERWAGMMLADLERGDYLPLVRGNALDKEIGAELWELSTKGGKPGVSGSKEALEVAKIIHKYQKLSVQRMNRAGAAIGQLDGYITRQTHDRGLLQKAGYETWKKDILPLLDVERTMKGADGEQFLKATYDGLVTGVHLKSNAAGTDKLTAFKGPANLAKRVSQERVLHFKDADSWMQYKNMYSRQNLMESAVMELERAAHNAVLMDDWGTNPQAAFEADIDWLREKYRSDPKMFKYVDGHRLGMMRAQFAEVDGSVNVPESYNLGFVGSSIRGWQNITKLGGAVISALSDIPIKASEVRYQGHGYLHGYANAFSSVLKGRGSRERREIAQLLGAGIDGLTGAIASRFSTNDNLPGHMTKMQRLFFKFNGLTWWTDVQKQGMGMFMSRHLASIRDASWGGLDADFRNAMSLYDIGGREWDVIRKSQVKMADGNEYITPDAIELLSDDVVAGYAGASDEAALRKARDQLQDKLGTWFNDRINTATLTPSARERAILNLGYARGTPAGEALRLFMQFKSFATSVLTRVVGRELHGKGSADFAGVMHLALMTTGFGYMAMSAKDILKGREPRDPEDMQTWKAAMLQGGGLGILGDFMFGEYNRFGGGGFTTLAGPTISDLDSWSRIYASARDGDDVWAKLSRELVESVPGSNLFYVRPALNYGFLYHLQEAMNPGYLRRMERNIERNNNQQFLFPPSEVVN